MRPRNWRMPKEAEETARLAAAQAAHEEAQVGTVTDYLLDHDACRLEYSDGHVDIIPFDDILKLLAETKDSPRPYTLWVLSTRDKEAHVMMLPP